MQAWQEEVERARQGQRDAESKLSSLEASINVFSFLIQLSLYEHSKVILVSFAG